MESVIFFERIKFLLVDVSETIADRFQDLETNSQRLQSLKSIYILILVFGLVSGDERKHSESSRQTEIQMRFRDNNANTRIISTITNTQFKVSTKPRPQSSIAGREGNESST